MPRSCAAFGSSQRTYCPVRCGGRDGSAASNIVNRMILERENAPPVVNPSGTRLSKELRKLRVSGPSSFASLTSERGEFLQVAGGRGGCLLEYKSLDGEVFHGYQDVPVVPFPDGTVLVFTAGSVELARNEWFSMKQVVEVFVGWLEGRPWPSWLHWRNITGLLGMR